MEREGNNMNTKLVRKQVEYLGIDSPDSPLQIKVELAGLRHAIKTIEEKIARYEQSLAIVNMELGESNGKLQEKGGDEKADTPSKEGS